MIDEAIVCDAIQECCEFGGWAVTAASFDDFAPDVLKNVFSCVAVVAQTQQVTVQRIIVASIQHFECSCIAVLVSQHQRAVVRNVAHCGSIG